DSERILTFGGFHWLPARQQLLEGDVPVRVGSRALGLLELLVEKAGAVVSQQQLMDAVWNGTVVDEANLRANIVALRKALGDGRDGRRYIVNVPGRGYRFVEPVTNDGRATVQLNGAAKDASPSIGARLIGRAKSLQDIVLELDRHRVLTVTGAGGIG